MSIVGSCLFCGETPCECNTRRKKKPIRREVKEPSSARARPDFTQPLESLTDPVILAAVRNLHQGGVISYGELRRSEQNMG